LSSIIIIAFFQSAYPTGQALNLDTLTNKECELLTTLATTMDLNKTLYIGEYPTMRYVTGIRDDWPVAGTYVNSAKIMHL
jgi:hypothetical protein